MACLGSESVTRPYWAILPSLEKAVMTYHLNYHLFPETLDILAQRQASGDPAYIEHNLLIDPWGNPYQYDPSGTRNQAGGSAVVMRSASFCSSTSQTHCVSSFAFSAGRFSRFCGGC